MNTCFDFSGKTALVTGGVSGIGAATSRAFRRAGASVIACGLTLARWADTDEIADPILFLCSDAARYMTGSVMVVDGGYTSVG